MNNEVSVDATDAAFGIAESDWLALATEMADVGRWAYRVEDGFCYLDDVLLRLTGLDVPQPMDAGQFLDRIEAEDRAAVVRTLEAAIADDKPFNMHFRYRRDDGRVMWLTGKGRPIRKADGALYVIGVNYDVTDLQTAVEANRLLAVEMAHRVKNVIALVSGIYRMASRTATDVDTLSKAFLDRLATLESLNTLIFASESRCVSLDDLFARIFGGLGDDPRVTLTLADFRLNGTAAQTVVLAVNELATNAVKYGALSREDGRLVVEVAVDVANDTFDLRWSETVPGGITPPSDRIGFGMTVLTRMTRHTFDGDPVLDWSDEGLRFSCRWSAAEMSGQTGPAAHEGRLLAEAERATAAVQPSD